MYEHSEVDDRVPDEHTDRSPAPSESGDVDPLDFSDDKGNDFFERLSRAAGDAVEEPAPSEDEDLDSNEGEENDEGDNEQGAQGTKDDVSIVHA